MKAIKSCAVVLSLLLNMLATPSTMSQPTLIASPNLNVSGNNGYQFPFNLGESQVESMRYQQVYASSDFATTMPLGGYISAIRFDVATDQNGGHPFLATLPRLQINLSTTTMAVDGLSTVFAQNVGADDTVVFGPSSITLSDDGFSGADIIIRFGTPFFYDPSAGNLLMDVRNFGGGSTSPFNANDSPGDTVSSLWSLSVGDPAGRLQTTGLITVFEVTPVPEPATVGLFVVAALFLGLFRRKLSAFKP